MLIGTKIRALRKSQKMTLVELSERSGVQVATISRIETGKMMGRLDSHMNIAKALGVDITQLYADDAVTAGKNFEAESQDPQTDQFKHNERSSYEILTKNLMTKKMMPILVRLETGGETPLEQGLTGSEKFIYVLDGRVEVTIDKSSYILEKAHTLYFNASLPHRLRNKGNKIAKVLCVGTPVML